MYIIVCRYALIDHKFSYSSLHRFAQPRKGKLLGIQGRSWWVAALLRQYDLCSYVCVAVECVFKGCGMYLYIDR
jgi:hypothetical protein